MQTKMAAIYERTKTSRIVKDYCLCHHKHKNKRTFHILYYCVVTYVCALIYQNTYVASCIVLFNILVTCHYYILIVENMYVCTVYV